VLVLEVNGRGRSVTGSSLGPVTVKLGLHVYSFMKMELIIAI